MNNSLIYKITYTLHRFGFYYYSVKYYTIDKTSDSHFKPFGYLINFIKGIFKMSKIFNYKYGYYEYLEIPITTKCSLRCKGCSNLMPCYDKPSDINKKTLMLSINKFLEMINNIVYIRILGGEPFVSSNLIDVLKVLLDSDKVQRVEIVTNGTIVPQNEELLNLMKNKKLRVSISKYPNVDIEKLINKLEENNIFYVIDKINFWMDYGSLKKKKRSKKELFKQYRKCNHICKSMLNGEIHLCPRSSHGKDLGIIPVKEGDYLNVLDDSIDVEEKKKKFNELLEKKCILACSYCDFATKASKKIPVAEQLKVKRK